METTAQASADHRELTPTEIQIAIAQIVDRLTRLAKAQTEIYKADEKWYSSPDNIGELDRKLFDSAVREKYEIPELVYLFEEGFMTGDVQKVKSAVNDLVRGKMTEASFWSLVFYFEEMRECDWGWIFLEKPFGYYSGKKGNIDEIIEEARTIATRSKNKNRPGFHFSWTYED